MALVTRSTKGSRNSAPKRNTSTPKRTTTKSSPIKIPTKVNEPPSKLTEYIIALFGEKGIGKTSLCAEFPNPITFMWEPRRRNLRIKQIPQQGEDPLDWERYESYVDLVCEDKKIQTVSVDTVDRCYEACFKHCCDARNITNPQQMGRDAHVAWNEIKMEFERVHFKLFEAEKCVIFVSHAREQEIVSRTGQAFDQIVPTCTPTVFKFLKAVCDFAFYYGYHDKERAMTVRGNELIWSATGVDETYLDPDDKEQLSVIPMGNSSKEAYKNLMDGFDNKTHGIILEYEEDEEEE